MEGLYDTIHRDLGPEAVVVRRDEGGGGLGRLLGRRRYELIAVVDDASADSHVLANAATSSEMRRLSTLFSEKCRKMEEHLSSLNRRMEKTHIAAGPLAGQQQLPGFAASWDRRFIEAATALAPGLFRDGGQTAARTTIGDLLNIEESFVPGGAGQRPCVMVLAGPTGSGKTTTLAKLAAGWHLDRGMKVGLITTDTYRIAAVDQTREYATLLGLDLHIVFSAAQAAKAIASMSDRDVILVDTPGRSHRDDIGMSSLKGILAAMGDVTVFLLVPATMDPANANEMLRNFGVLKPDYVILTKIDEVHTAPVMTSISSEMTAPLAYVTDGQRVPQDIRQARRDEMVEILLGGAFAGAEEGAVPVTECEC